MPALEALPEPERNRLLRRADWRFLLGDPAPDQSLVMASGPLAEAVGAISGKVIGSNAPAGSCNLVVAETLSASALNAAWAALRPGGSLYLESRRPLVGGAARLRRRLEGIGFTEVECYWAWPAPGHTPTAFWLPLEAPEATNHFLAGRAVAASRAGRLGQTGLRKSWQVARRAGLLFPICATAQKPGSPTGGVAAPMGVLTSVRENWRAWGFGSPPKRLASILLAGGKHSLNKVVRVLYAEGESCPRLVIKYPRVAEAARALRQEAAVLVRVQASRPGGMEAAPRLLHLWEDASGLALAESALGGVPLYTVLTPANTRDLALRVADWLAQLAGQGAPRPRDEWWERLIAAPLRDLEESFPSAGDRERHAATLACLARLGDMPLTVEQRDCAPWNILVDDYGRLAVLDWESAEANGLPGIDLIYFMAYLAFFRSGAMKTGGYREAWRAALDPATDIGRLSAECEEHYLAHTGLHRERLPALRVLTWLTHLHSELRRREAVTGIRPSAGELRQSLFFNLWDEALRAAEPASAMAEAA